MLLSILTGPTRDRSVGIDQVLEAVLVPELFCLCSRVRSQPCPLPCFLVFPPPALLPQLAWAPGSGYPGHGLTQKTAALSVLEAGL